MNTFSESIVLTAIQEEYNSKQSLIVKHIRVCAGTGCIANGSREVYNRFVECVSEHNHELLTKIEFVQEENSFVATTSGCQGFCQMGPLVTIDHPDVMYIKVRVEDVDEIVSRTVINNEIVNRLCYRDKEKKQYCPTTSEIAFYSKQHRLVLKGCGTIDPEDIKCYIASGGYESAKKVLTSFTDVEICNLIEQSGLRGRGGGGFTTGKKWHFTRVVESEKKYLICNGDEGDPGAFMDRSVMEGNPHSVIEGMTIAAKAIGANKGYVYVRAEYPLAVVRMRKAVEDAYQYGLLGENILESGFSFNIHIMEGAGAFVCGEETALMQSIEGSRGMPVPKPPFPAEKGLFGKPTVINNVETLATVPIIISMGVEEYRKLGTAKSPGTKTFALTGHVVNTGLIEVPFGTTLNEIIFDIGGGVTYRGKAANRSKFKAVQIGGPSGGCLSEKYLDLPLDFDSLQSIGAMVGSGGLVVMNSDTCVVKMAHFFMQFTQNESCGKCVLCREGTYQLLQLLEDIIEGRATNHTLTLLEQLASAVKKGSLCGLGKTAPNPILSMLKEFREEFEEHVFQHKCRANKCKQFLKPTISQELCRGCGVCLLSCPVNAIIGSPKQPHKIDEEKCIKCGACITACKLEAVA